jgi:hypothetical protein
MEWLRRAGAWLARHWGFPSNIQWWWALLGLPAVPAVLAGVATFLREAPLWQILSAVLAVYLVFFLLTIPLQNWLSDKLARHREPERESQLETQERWRGQDALDAYLHQMQQWSDDENKPLGYFAIRRFAPQDGTNADANHTEATRPEW